MSEKFEREERYIVFKVKDLSQHKLGWVRDVIRLNGIPTVDAVVVESDWPEYEPTWAAIERRVTGAPAWVGVGLPPVGTVCEYTGHKHGLKPGARVEIIHHFNAGSADVAAFIYSQGAGMERHVAQSIADNFRPIRTPEQIAAEERRGEIATLVQHICADGAFDCDDPEVSEAAAKIYDAGYRKQVAP